MSFLVQEVAPKQNPVPMLVPMPAPTLVPMLPLSVEVFRRI